MPRSEAAVTSMVSMPAPARITRARLGPGLERVGGDLGAPHDQDVRIVLLERRGSVSAVRSGWETTRTAELLEAVDADFLELVRDQDFHGSLLK